MNQLMKAGVVCISLLLPTQAVAQQSEASRKALESAAAKGSAPAQYALGAAAEADGDLQAALGWFGKAAFQNYAPAQFKSGEVSEKTNGKSEDVLFWYRKAAAQGFAPAIARLRELDPTAANAAPASGDSAPATTTDDAPRAAPLTASPPPTQPETAAPAPVVQPPVHTPTPTTSASAEAVPGRVFWIATGVEGVVLWLGIRALLMAWYRSGTWFYSGRDATGVLTAQIGNRVKFEKLALFFGFGIAFLSNVLLRMWWNGDFK